ncbi:MAG: MmgE/PrpD family protein [Pseudomonadota bacterium]
MSQTVQGQESALAACPPLEQAVVRFILDTHPRDLGPQTRAGVSTLLRDQLAMQVGSSTLPWSRKILSFATERKLPGRSSVIASHLKMSAIDAAFVNAVYGHGFEYDDAHRESASHPGSCVVPAAIAIGEELGKSMDDVIAAIAIGYDVYTRIGALAAPDLLKRGFHPHAVLANFGAAAVSAKLRGFDGETTLHALAIALSHASGTTEYTSTGGSIKRVHAGIGTKNGMVAAGLAQAGITGPRAFLSGNKGFFQTFLQRGPGEAAADRFSSTRQHEVERVWLKPYCCCGCNHAYVDAIRPFTSRAGEVTEIVAKIQRSANVVVGTANANAYAPKNIEHVQYSVPVQMAFALLGLGNGYQVHKDYLDGKLDMDKVLATAGRIKLVEAPELDERYPGKFVADITVKFADGRTEHVFVEDPIGTLENRMPEAEQDSKFMDLTTGVLGQSRAKALLSALRELNPRMPVGELVAMCTV